MAVPTTPTNQPDGEKKRKTNPPNPTATQPNATITTLSLILSEPLQVSLTPSGSFLGENLHLYLGSPFPNLSHTTPNYKNLTNSFTTTSTADTSTTSTMMTHTTPTTSLKDRLLAAKERKKKDAQNTISVKDPIEKYTKNTFTTKCKIHHSHPMAALDHIDIDQVGKWKTLPDDKLLAHPFGHEVKTLTNHLGIKSKIFEAIGEITQSNSVEVNAPWPFNHEIGTPIVFLIYNISKIHRQMLLDHQVWSSSEITF